MFLLVQKYCNFLINFDQQWLSAMQRSISIQNCHWFQKVVSAIAMCSLFLSAIKRFFYETLTMILSVLYPYPLDTLNQSLEVSDFLHDGRRQQRTSFEYDIISENNKKVSKIGFLAFFVLTVWRQFQIFCTMLKAIPNII